MTEEPDLKDIPEYGPYLGAALFCERILQEKDGINSAIRIIDRVTHVFSPSDPSTKLEPFIYNLSLLIILKTGENPGLTTIRVVPIKPNNDKLLEWNQTINMESPSNRGATLVMNFVINFDLGGVWWFEVYVNERIRTKIPMEVIYLPQIIKQMHDQRGGWGRQNS